MLCQSTISFWMHTSQPCFLFLSTAMAWTITPSSWKYGIPAYKTPLGAATLDATCRELAINSNPSGQHSRSHSHTHSHTGNLSILEHCNGSAAKRGMEMGMGMVMVELLALSLSVGLTTVAKPVYPLLKPIVVIIIIAPSYCDYVYVYVYLNVWLLKRWLVWYIDDHHSICCIQPMQFQSFAVSFIYIYTHTHCNKIQATNCCSSSSWMQFSTPSSVDPSTQQYVVAFYIFYICSILFLYIFIFFFIFFTLYMRFYIPCRNNAF